MLHIVIVNLRIYTAFVCLFVCLHTVLLMILTVGIDFDHFIEWKITIT